MRVLVSAASKHGATSEIGQAIGDALDKAGLEVVVLPPDAVTTIEDFDAVVLGSAIYTGRWMDSAKQLIERERAALISRPVWLFSSGPVGDPPVPEGEPPDVAALREQTGARDHRIFPGRIDRRRLGFVEKAMVGAVKAPDGDFRPWDEIKLWALEIAVALREITPASGR
jgi:menaquinone-dependent protoporphyrinogen oxidase